MKKVIAILLTSHCVFALSYTFLIGPHSHCGFELTIQILEAGAEDSVHQDYPCTDDLSPTNFQTSTALKTEYRAFPKMADESSYQTNTVGPRVQMEVPN